MARGSVRSAAKIENAAMTESTTNTGAEAEDIAGRARKRCRHHIAGMIARFVAAELVRETTLAHKAERDGINRRSDGRAGNARHDLRGADDAKVRPDQDRHRRCNNSHRGGDHDRAFRTRPIHESAERSRDCHTSDAADRHDDTDFSRRPLPSLQKDAEERPQARLHVSHEEIQSIEGEQRSGHEE